MQLPDKLLASCTRHPKDYALLLRSSFDNKPFFGGALFSRIP